MCPVGTSISHVCACVSIMHSCTDTDLHPAAADFFHTAERAIWDSHPSCVRTPPCPAYIHNLHRTVR